MLLEFSTTLIVALGFVVLAAGMVNGLAGFGFALVGTMALATVVDPTTAVVFMIAPILAVNLSLVKDLSADQLQSCGRRFAPLILSALVGTIVGLIVLNRVPTKPLKAGLGIVTLMYVVTTQNFITVPGQSRVEEGCFVESPPAMASIGAVSGLLFGGTNVGVQVIAYLRSCNLPQGLFIGVVAMVFLGLNSVRMGVAGLLGLYPSTAVAGASVIAAAPAVVGVRIGKRLRNVLNERRRQAIVLGLLMTIGIRLSLAGFGIV